MKKGLAFFQGNRFDEIRKSMNSEVELGEAISIVYLYIEEQFKFVYKVLLSGY